jgi:excisionase family DNA binding protein
MSSVEAYMTVKEAAERLGLSESRVYELVSSEQLPATRVHGKAWVIRRKDVERFAELPPGTPGHPKTLKARRKKQR